VFYRKMTGMKLWIVVAVLLAMPVVQAAESVDSTFDRLAKVDVFAFWAICKRSAMRWSASAPSMATDLRSFRNRCAPRRRRC
jgi:hypothetical protein